MSEFNYVEQPIIPYMPKTVPNEVLHVYVPRATYKIPGIASFSEKYFILTSKGEVRLVDNIVDIIRNAASKTYVDDSLKSTVNDIDKSLSGKLDKVTEPTAIHQAYVKYDSGMQAMTGISPSAMSGTIMYRDNNGNCSIVEPTEDAHIANKEYVDTATGGKVDKLAASSTHHLAYLKLMDGRDVGQPVSPSAEAHTVIIRDANGRASINTPVSDAQIANKKYVDDELAKFDFIKVVSSLDAVANPLPNKIYLVPNENSDAQNLFDEWIFVNGKWEWITTKEIDVDLTDYATIEYVDRTMEDTSDALDEIIEIQNTLVDGGNPNTSWLIDKIYPVGSIYMSVNDINPDLIFGGTWEKIQGRFLLGAGDKYALGAKGGAEMVTLTTAHMPNHGHDIYMDTTGSYGMGQRIDNDASTGETGIAPHGGYASGTRVGTVSITKSGGNQPHDNMPPYLAVNMWKRTA